MPIDAFRQGDQFVVQFDLPGVSADSIDLTVERNVLTVHAQRDRSFRDDDVELLIGERPHGTFSRQLFLGDTLDTERSEGRVTRRRAAGANPRSRAGQAAERSMSLPAGATRVLASSTPTSEPQPEGVGAARS